MTGQSDPLELRSILTTTKVGELTLAMRPTLSPSDEVTKAASEMRKVVHGCVVIVDDNEKLVGIFTERDLLKVIAEKGSLNVPLSETMTQNPQTVSVDESLFDATRLMDEGGYRRVPVVDVDGIPVGIVDVKTVTHFLVEHFPNTIYNQVSQSKLNLSNREGA